MYVLACIPIYGDCGRDSCCNPAGSQESAPELGIGYIFAIKNAPLSGSLNTCRHIGTSPMPVSELEICRQLNQFAEINLSANLVS
jgi:hypothetical protein